MAERPIAVDPDGRPAPLGWRRPDWARLASEQPELAALIVRERAHTFRTVVSALVFVALAGCLIPIVTARPRYRPGPR
jgi:hypothetical protein